MEYMVQLFLIFFLIHLVHSMPPKTNRSKDNCPERCVCNKTGKGSSYVTCKNQTLNDVPQSKGEVSVVMLDVSYNNLKILQSRVFQNYPHLIELNLKSNELRDVDSKAFNGLASLRNIDLSDNYIESIYSDIFNDSPNLRSVVLSNNKLSQVPSDIPFLIAPSLKVLNASDCGLTQISSAFFSRVPNLEVLDLSSNLIKDLSWETLDSLSHLKKTKLDGNFLQCRSQFLALLCWLFKKNLLSIVNRKVPFACYDENAQPYTIWTPLEEGQLCREVEPNDWLDHEEQFNVSFKRIIAERSIRPIYCWRSINSKKLQYIFFLIFSIISVVTFFVLTKRLRKKPVNTNVFEKL